MSLPEPLNSMLAFVVVLGVLIFVHEWGHYAAARSVKVRVEVFSIGFGKAIWSRVGRDGTLWKLGWMPLGGYVKLHGQEPPEPGTEPGVHAHDSFAAKPVWARAWIVAAGPLANFVLAALLFMGLFWTQGTPREATPPQAQIFEVVADTPGAKAGLQAGDIILAIEGRPIARFEELQAIARASADKPLRVDIQRGEARLPLVVTPAMRDGAGFIGIKGGQLSRMEAVGPVEAVSSGLKRTWFIVSETARALWGMATLQRSAADVGGPVAIAKMSGEVASLGLAALVTFIAVLSVNLGLLNLLPIPILDGGHLVLFGIEALRGRPLPARAVEYGFRAGFALLMAVFVAVTWKDLNGLGLFRWVSGLFG